MATMHQVYRSEFRASGLGDELIWAKMLDLDSTAHGRLTRICSMYEQLRQARDYVRQPFFDAYAGLDDASSLSPGVSALLEAVREEEVEIFVFEYSFAFAVPIPMELTKKGERAQNTDVQAFRSCVGSLWGIPELCPARSAFHVTPTDEDSQLNVDLTKVCGFGQR